MNADRKKQIGAIHFGKKSLGLDEDTYRAMLERVTGKTSAADMDTRELALVLDEMRRLGVKRKPGTEKDFTRSADPLLRKMFAMWKAMGADGIVIDPSRPALRAFVKRQTGIDNPEWLTGSDVSKVIEAFKQWRARVESERAS